VNAVALVAMQATFSMMCMLKHDCAVQLIALATDQVEKCDECSIEAELWNSSVPAAKLEMLTRELCSAEPTLKLLYTTPGAQHWLFTAHSLHVLGLDIHCSHG
jgi:hypothetical protein